MLSPALLTLALLSLALLALKMRTLALLFPTRRTQRCRSRVGTASVGCIHWGVGGGEGGGGQARRQGQGGRIGTDTCLDQVMVLGWPNEQIA